MVTRISSTFKGCTFFLKTAEDIFPFHQNEEEFSEIRQGIFRILSETAKEISVSNKI